MTVENFILILNGGLGLFLLIGSIVVIREGILTIRKKKKMETLKGGVKL